LARGQIIAAGPPAEIEVHPEVLTEYLGVKTPAADNLLRSAGTSTATLPEVDEND
jgi:hypothetical protein